MATKALTDSASISSRSSSFYRPELDALRFFACLAVFVHHIGLTRGFIMHNRWLRPVGQAGGFGVCLFFLLSAYLITELLWKERDRTGSIHLRSFYVRRILRIWPLYFACLLLYGVMAYFLPQYRVSSGRIMAIIFLAGNWYCAFFGWANLALDPLWSISVEEQFYILVPTIAKLGGKRAIWWASGVFLVLSQATLVFLGIHGVKAAPPIWTNSFVQFQFFAAGCVLALVLQDRGLSLRWPVRLFMFGAGLLCWTIAAGPLRVRGLPVEPSAAGLCFGYLLVLAGSVLLFLAAYGIPARRIPRSMIYLGKISFGLYLFHGFTLEIVHHTGVSNYVDKLKHFFPFGDILIEAGFTFLAASLSYRYLEKPFLRLKDRFAIVHSRPA